MFRVEYKTKQGKTYFYAAYGDVWEAMQAVTSIWKNGTNQCIKEDIIEVILVIYDNTAPI